MTEEIKDNLDDGNAPAPTDTSKESNTESQTSKETIIEGADAQAQEAKAAPTWPDNWRDLVAGDDVKERKRLERFASPADLYKSNRALEQKLSSGEYKTVKPKDETPEALAEWRKENGIPEKPEDYDITLADGLVIGEDDKPLVGEFLKEMHGANAHPEAVKSALTAYYKIVQQQQIAQEEEDSEFRRNAEDELRAEWGGDYRKNAKMIDGLLNTAPEGLKDRILGARLADGKKLGDDPQALKFLAGLAREINPLSTIVPGSGNNAAAAVDDRIAAIEKMMGDNSSEYWVGSNADKIQAEYRDLITARDKHNARAA